MDISKYIGIPFKDKGRNFEGLDCWGLVWLIYLKELGIELPSYTEQYVTAYDQEFLKVLIQEACESSIWQSIESDFEKPGDVILFRILNCPCHVGLIVKKEYMVHVWKDINVCIERYTTSLWRTRLRGFYRYAR